MKWIQINPIKHKDAVQKKKKKDQGANNSVTPDPSRPCFNVLGLEMNLISVDVIPQTFFYSD